MFRFLSKAKKESPQSQRTADAPRQTLMRAIKHPEWLSVRQNDGRLIIGPDQSWYPKELQRKMGCGPTTAALISAYIARKPGLVSLYKPYKGASRSAGYIDAEHLFTQDEMLRQMEDLWRYIKPSRPGLWRSSQLARGLKEFTRSCGLPLDTRRFLINLTTPRSHKLWAEMLQFIRHNLVYDIPLAWLIYDNKKMTDVQPWHWVTITGISYSADFQDCVLELVDHKHRLEVNPRDWFDHSALGGAIVAFRPYPSKQV